MSTSAEHRWLAFDTSTDVLSLAVARGDQVWTQTLPGGPQASSGLIPAVLAGNWRPGGVWIGRIQAGAALQGLAQLAGLKRLQKVFVFNTKVTAGGAAALQKAIPGVVVNLGE